MEQLWQQSPAGSHGCARRAEGTAALLSLGDADRVCPCSGSHVEVGKGMGRGVQKGTVLLISRVLTFAWGLMEEGGGWMLPEG